MFKKIISIVLTAFMLTGTLLGAFTLGVGAEDTEKVTPADPNELAGKLINSVSEMEHPYVIYSDDEIPALQEKVKQGISEKAFALLTTFAPSYSNASLTVKVGANGVIGRQLQHYISYVAIYSAIADRPDLAKNVINLVVSCAQQGDIDVYKGINDALCVGDFGHAYALAYDMLYEYMTEEQRALIKAEMEEIGEWLFVNSPKINTWGADTDNRKAWNWNAVTHGALGLIALSLGEHEDWLALAINRMEGYYKNAVDATGAAFEGLHYIGYAFNSWAPLGNAIYRLSGVEVMDAYPQMQQMPYWSMYMNAPHEGEQAKINQGSGIDNYASPFYIINRYKQSDALWGWLHTYKLFGDAKFSPEYQGNGWSAPQIILYEDQSFDPVAPTADSNPLIKTFEKGLVIARDSWDNDAAMMTFTCGYGQSGCWNHPDDSTFTFFAKGESFIVDLGAGRNTSAEHNVVLIDGSGMDYVGGPTMVKGDLRENYLLENGNLYLCGSNLTSYKRLSLKASTRQLVFGGGETPFVLVFDYMRKDGSSHTYTTNFYTQATSTVTVDESGKFATIKGASNGALCYVIPYSAEGVTLTANVGTAKAITTENTASLHRQATLFITANPDGSMPQAEFSTDARNTTVTISRTLQGEVTTETYVFSLEELISPAEAVETSETESVAVTETESETETETQSATEPITKSEPTKTEEITEATTLEESNATETQSTPAEKTGCGASIGAAILPATAIGAAAIIIKKKKKQ